MGRLCMCTMMWSCDARGKINVAEVVIAGSSVVPKWLCWWDEFDGEVIMRCCLTNNGVLSSSKTWFHGRGKLKHVRIRGTCGYESKWWFWLVSFDDAFSWSVLWTWFLWKKCSTMWFDLRGSHQRDTERVSYCTMCYRFLSRRSNCQELPQKLRCALFSIERISTGQSTAFLLFCCFRNACLQWIAQVRYVCVYQSSSHSTIDSVRYERMNTVSFNWTAH